MLIQYCISKCFLNCKIGIHFTVQATHVLNSLLKLIGNVILNENLHSNPIPISVQIVFTNEKHRSSLYIEKHHQFIIHLSWGVVLCLARMHSTTRNAIPQGINKLYHRFPIIVCYAVSIIFQLRDICVPSMALYPFNDSLYHYPYIE